MTPGRTAPDGSLTVPATLPSTCAALTHGTLRSARARSRTLRIRIRITVPPGSPRQFFAMRIRFPYTDRGIRLEPEAVKAAATVGLLEQHDSCHDSSIGDVLHGLAAVGQSIDPSSPRARTCAFVVVAYEVSWIRLECVRGSGHRRLRRQRSVVSANSADWSCRSRRKFLISDAGTYGYNPAFAWRKTPRLNSSPRSNAGCESCRHFPASIPS